MKSIEELFKNNRKWAASLEVRTPGFFEALQKKQSPGYFWIGCADSRVPANDVVGLLPGELFVHRNIANQVICADLNILSALQYAIEVLHIEHVIVCGHYNCGGVREAMNPPLHGMIDNWLSPIRNLYHSRRRRLEKLADERLQFDRLCEWNVVEQVLNASRTTVVQEAWHRGQYVAVHAWIYDLADGRLHDLGPCITSPEGVEELERAAGEHPDKICLRRDNPIQGKEHA